MASSHVVTPEAAVRRFLEFLDRPDGTAGDVWERIRDDLNRRLVCGEGPRWWRRSLVAFLRATAGLARESPAASGLALPGCASLPLPGRGLTRQRRERSSF